MRLASELSQPEVCVDVDEVQFRLLLSTSRASLLVERGLLDLAERALHRGRADRRGEERQDRRAEVGLQRRLGNPVAPRSSA